MRTTPITENLIQLTRSGFVNAYLVREDDGFTLVDTTLRGGAGELIAAARLAGGDIRRIVLTHGHGDHVGSLDALKDATGVDVYMPEIDARIHAGETPYEGKLKGGWPKIKTVPDVRINPGDRVGSLEVVGSPGHTPGHVALLDTRDRALIAGDAYATFGGVSTPERMYWRFPLVAFATWDRVKAGESARALRLLEPSLLAAGHGKVVKQPGEAMAKACRARA
jgi:glyoxylase-like metal-dependent hydrolase (beta-lactamase superfamily II)